ncbi:DUF6516 family protein [Thioalkalicoccus limnaeus]|uniref:DUF6516 family protein n=1 Tax=Thioalkalicoccus limnaeus TaxID=120681 RepID=A0ABV4BEJ5_9GAMM
MRPILIQKRRYDLADDRFVSVSVFELPAPLPGSTHRFKYRLALVVAGVCVLRYDNESGKGDHKHLGSREVPYSFVSLDRLLEDFWADVSRP